MLQNISVIIPVYNAEKYIEKAVNSALFFEEVSEVILVEDSSPDNALAICQKLEREHKRVHLYTHPNNENRGAGASRNLGIAKATGEFIAFLDADDFYLPNRFLRDKELFADTSDADGCYNAMAPHFYSKKAEENFKSSFSMHTTTVYRAATPSPENLFEGLTGLISKYGYFSLNTLTLKKCCLEWSQLKFNESLSVHQDTEFIIRASYYLKLYPSEIEIPVAMRGVHDENRITINNQQDLHKKSLKRFMMWDSLWKWAKKEMIEQKYQKYLRDKSVFYQLLTNEKYNFQTLVGEVIKNPSILNNHDYSQIHRHFTKAQPKWLQIFLFKVRNLLIKFI